MKNPRTKKYPIFTYLCWLLVVAMLFTGVTFSRYSITQSGSLSTDIASLNCGYTVDNISSFNFINNDYIEEGTASGTGARTVRFRLRNYDSDNVISAVALDGNIRLYLPADLADNLAIQVRTDRVVTTENGQKTSLTNEVYSPQITLGDVLYYGGTDSNGHIERGDSYHDFDTNSVTDLSTDDFSDRSVSQHISRDLKVTGGLSKINADGELSASGTVKIQTMSADGSTDSNDVSITISAETATIPYNIGFQRGGTAPALYLDLEREEIYYTIDISVPYMQYEANIATESEHVVFFTLVEKVDSSIHWQIGATDPDDGSYKTTLQRVTYNNEGEVSGTETLNTENMDVLITTPPASNQEYRIVRTYQDNTPDVDTDNPVEYAKVLGYHFEQDAAMLKTGSTAEYEGTTVRVKCTYNNAGGYDVSLYHVAQVNEGDGYYVHPIIFGDTSSTVIENVSYEYTFDSDDSYSTGKCQSDNGRTISLKHIQANPFTYLDWEVNADGTIPDSGTSRTVEMSALVSRSYYLRMHAVFVQASQTPSQGGN